MSPFFPVAVPKKGLSVVVQCLRITPGRVVAVGRIKFAVHAEVQCAAVVVCRAAQVVKVKHDDFTRGRRNVSNAVKRLIRL
jgi:hypothetical protein